MKTYWFLSSKGGIGKTLLCLNSIIFLLRDCNKIDKSLNLLLIDINSVNTDLFNIFLKLKGYKSMLEYKDIHIIISTINEVKKDYIGYKLKGDNYNLFFCRDLDDLSLFASPLDRVQRINNIIDRVINDNIMNDIDYVFIDTNLHLQNLIPHRHTYFDKVEKKVVIEDLIKKVEFNQMLSILKKINSKYFFFLTWSAFLNEYEYTNLVGLDPIIKTKEEIINIINMYAFLSNIGAHGSVSNIWKEVVRCNVSNKGITQAEIFTKLVSKYQEYLKKRKSDSNFRNLKELGKSFKAGFKDNQRYKNILVLPEFYFYIKGYTEIILRNPDAEISDVIKFFSSNYGRYMDIQNLINEHYRSVIC